MKLLCVSHYFAGHGGGIERVVARLTEQLAAGGADVTWAATGDAERGEAVATLPLKAWNATERFGLPFPVPRPRSVAALCRAVRDHDLVIVHDGMYLTSVVAMIACLAMRRPSILVQHVGRVPMSSALLAVVMRAVDRIVTRPMLRLASRVVFISDTSRRHFADLVLKSDPELIFNGVDTTIFGLGDGAPEAQPAALPNDKPVALFVGRFVEKKGVLRLKRLAQRRPHIHWAFAGQGPIDPDDWGLANVSTHRGLAGPALASLYRTADLLVLPSTSEGFPLVVQEALACGLRIACCTDAVTADPSAVPYLTPIAVDPSDEDLTLGRIDAAVETALSLPNTAAHREARARFAASRYSWSAAALRYAAIANSLLRDPMPVAKPGQAWPAS